MDSQTAWANLAQAINAMQSPAGDYNLKLNTVMAAVQLLFECPPEEVLQQVEKAALPTRATVSWLVFEGGRLPGVDAAAVETLRVLYEDTCAPGEGVIPPPPMFGAGGQA